MIDNRVVIGNRRSVKNGDTVEIAFGAGLGQPNGKVVAHKSTAGDDRCTCCTCITGNDSSRRSDMRGMVDVVHDLNVS